jgi:putative acyl-CoA dehydrogenase
MGREAEAIPALMTELEKARGNHPNLDRAIDDLRDEVTDTDGIEGRMRMITEMIALTLQGALLTSHGPPEVAEAFCASRLAARYRGAFGTLPSGCDLDAIITRALPN